MKFINSLIAVIFSIPALTQQKIKINNPPPAPELFAEGIISTSARERDFAISPDGNELFYTLQSPHGMFQTILCRKKLRSGKWSAPGIAPFSGRFTDLEPSFSPDGNRIYFSSNRPVRGSEEKDFDIWYVERSAGGWSEPVNPGYPLNRSHDEFYPMVTKSGNIYFTASYHGEKNKEDIYMAKWENGKYLDPLPLDTMINSPHFEFNAYVSPGEDLIIFTSYGREDDMGGGDLYISYRDSSGNLTRASHLAALNSPKLDYCPAVSPDGTILFFTSERNELLSHYPDRITYDELAKKYSGPLNGGGNIYWVDFTLLKRSLGIK